MLTVRLDRISDARGTHPAAALSERFIEAMDAEHRQMGLNDPTLGKQVRKMVGSLSRRVADWREAAAGTAEWEATARSSVYGNSEPSAAALAYCAIHLRQFWTRLDEAADEQLLAGEF